MRKGTLQALLRSLAIVGSLWVLGLITPPVLPAWISVPEYRSNQLQIRRQVNLNREIQRLRANQMSRELKQQIHDLNAREEKRRLELGLWKSRLTNTAPVAPWPAVIPDTTVQPSAKLKPDQDKDKQRNSTEAQRSAEGSSQAGPATTGETRR